MEEIIATMTPFDKVILWAIGVGNYNAADIYEEANKKLKEWDAQQGSIQSSKRSSMSLQSCPKKAVKA